jgi:hypothetical protein
MTEQLPPPGSDEPDPETGRTDESTASTEAARTGVPALDQVLDDVDQLDDRPLDEHVAAFERAHDALHSALDAEPGEPGEPA